MHRVLAARSLKFVEQREEDTVGYQRQFKEARNAATATSTGGLGKGGGGGGRRNRHSSPSRRSEEKEHDLDPLGEPRRPLTSGGHFNIMTPDRPPGNGQSGAYARQAGEKSAVSTPLLGYPPKDSGSAASSAAAVAAAASTAAPVRPHATIILHEKKDKSDQLHMRIAAFVAAPAMRNSSALLVDEAVQKRLAKNQRKKAAVEAELTALRKRAAAAAAAAAALKSDGVSQDSTRTSSSQRKQLSQSQSTGALDTLAALAHASAHSGMGVGVWSSLGTRYQEQGGPDLSLPTLNTGVPLRELTKSKQVRPPPLKESSEHRKRYEALVELFRAQRHRVVQPPLRDGQNGVPRVEVTPSGPPTGLLAGMGLLGAAAEFDPALTDLSTDNRGAGGGGGNGVNPANQSLLARLYQTQAQGWTAANQQAASGRSLDDIDHNTGSNRAASAGARTLSHSVSAAAVLTKGSAATPAGGVKDAMTSVDRIAALQPRKWDSYSVRQLASSATVPSLFERRPPGAAGLGVGMGGVWAGGGGGRNTGPVSLASLPDSHPAHTHPAVHPMAPSASIAKALQAEALAKEKMDFANTAAMLGQSGKEQVHLLQQIQNGGIATAGVGTVGGKTGGLASTSSGTSGGQHVKFADPPAEPSEHRRTPSVSAQRTVVGALSEDLTAEESMARRAESLAHHRNRIAKKKAKEAAEREIFAAVMKQLNESRLDHLHRWRNAFDGTKQKMDRLLIKRLVSRAENRAAALDGGVEAMEPVVNAVLSEQELSEVALAGDHGIGGSPSSGSRSRASLRPSSLRASSSSHSLLGGYSRERLLADDFAITDAMPYDEHAGMDDYGASGGGSEPSLSQYERMERSIQDSHAATQQLAHQLTQDNAYAHRQKQQSGVQHSDNSRLVLER